MTHRYRAHALGSGEVYVSITPIFHAIYGLIVVANVLMIVLTVIIIVQTVRWCREMCTSNGKEKVMEVQKMVILVAVSYCLSSIPAAVVYVLRAINFCINTESHRVPLRTTNAVFHILNSGVNFFIYVGISPAFRKHFLNASGLARFVGGGRMKKPASMVSKAHAATAKLRDLRSEIQIDSTD